MNPVIIYSVLSLTVIGVVAAVILYLVARKFKVIEDPKIDLIAEILPAANCGGCGYAGCRAFAESISRSDSLEGFNCPVGGNETMKLVGQIMGMEALDKEPQIAVLRCNGTHVNSPAKINYDGPATCAFAHNLYVGAGGCPNGCLGLGDCVIACRFDAIHIDIETGLPLVNDKCTACGACVKACPRKIIELRPKGKKDRRIYVTCANEEKGGPARKNCLVACIGCGKCLEICPHEAIVLNNNLAYIDADKCKLCRKCVEVCPTEAIIELNFPPRKKKVEEVANEAEQTETNIQSA